MEGQGQIPTDPVSLATSVEQHGVSFVLTLVCFAVGWLYWQERKENKALYGKILENGKEMTAIAIGVQAAVSGLKDVVQAALNALSKKE